MALRPPPTHPTYDTLEEATAAINTHAYAQGYAVMRRSSKKRRGAIYQALLACTKSGTDRTRREEAPRVRNTSSRKTNCPFLLRLDLAGGVWVVTVVRAGHNHWAARPGALPQHRALDPGALAVVQDLTESGVGAREVAAAVARTDPGALFTNRDIYNARARLREEALGSMTALQALVAQLRRDDWTFDLSVDVWGRLDRLFMVHPRSVELFKAHPDVLLMDCTYKTNRYHLPLLNVAGVTSLGHTFHVAFAFIRQERVEDYFWALGRLRCLYEAHFDMREATEASRTPGQGTETPNFDARPAPVPSEAVDTLPGDPGDPGPPPPMPEPPEDTTINYLDPELSSDSDLEALDALLEGPARRRAQHEARRQPEQPAPPSYEETLSARPRRRHPGPLTVVTDCDQGLISALQRTWPHHKHLLCLWHIEKNVLSKGKDLFRTREKREGLAQALLVDWTSVVNSTTEDDYDKRLRKLRETWGAYEGVLEYVEGQWLDRWKQRVVRAWTNKVLHFGHTVTSRIESCHAALKRQLKASVGDLRAVALKIDLLITNQVREHHLAVAAARDRLPRDLRRPEFSLVVHHVSDYALRRVRDAGVRLRHGARTQLPPCDGVLRATMGLPCAHVLQMRLRSNAPLQPADFHPQWLLDRLSGSESCLPPQLFLLQDPVPVTRHRRGLGSRNREPASSTRRDPSQFEYVEQAFASAARDETRRQKILEDGERAAARQLLREMERGKSLPLYYAYANLCAQS